MANDKVYRVGLVGFRGRGRGLANFWNAVPNAKLVALADDVKEHCDEAKELFPGLQTFNSHKEMLDNDPNEINLDYYTTKMLEGDSYLSIENEIKNSEEGK